MRTIAKFLARNKGFITFMLCRSCSAARWPTGTWLLIGLPGDAWRCATTCSPSTSASPPPHRTMTCRIRPATKSNAKAHPARDPHVCPPAQPRAAPGGRCRPANTCAGCRPRQQRGLPLSRLLQRSDILRNAFGACVVSIARPNHHYRPRARRSARRWTECIARSEFTRANPWANESMHLARMNNPTASLPRGRPFLALGKVGFAEPFVQIQAIQGGGFLANGLNSAATRCVKHMQLECGMIRKWLSPFYDCTFGIWHVMAISDQNIGHRVIMRRPKAFLSASPDET